MHRWIDLDEYMLMHVKLAQINSGYVRLENVGKAVDYMRQDCENTFGSEGEFCDSSE